MPGDSVKAVIPAEAVHLESGYFRLGKRRWNRWVGRIVLTEIWRDRLIVTVKLHNDPVTLKCCGSLAGRQWAPQVWDTVNIVVDPIKISLDLCMPDETAQAVCHEAETSNHLRDTRVWLTARVTEISEASEGEFLSLLIGTARVSVFIAREEDSFRQWTSGEILDIHVGRYDAWLKPRGSENERILCGVLFLDSRSIPVTR